MRKNKHSIALTQWTIIAAFWMKALHIVLKRRNKSEQNNMTVNGSCAFVYLAKHPLEMIWTNDEWCKHTNPQRITEAETAAIGSFPFKTVAD